MAELTSTPTADRESTAAQSCCAPAERATCCGPADKTACCDASRAGKSCGCAAGQRDEPEELREVVRERYAAAARAVVEEGAACDCASLSTGDAALTQVFGSALYDDGQAEGATATAVQASLGCGVPTAVADLHAGETVLDLGSGGGADVLISTRRVAPTGRAIGLDMTDEMLELARANAAEAGVENVEFVKGYIEDIPLPQASVDVVISNCVINLSADKPRVLREAARVLRPGGRFAVSDVIADGDMDAATRADMQAWTGCIAGALTRAEFERALLDAGLVDVEIRETHRVHEHASSAIVRARKPPAEAPLDAAPAGRARAASRASGGRCRDRRRRPVRARCGLRRTSGGAARVVLEAGAEPVGSWPHYYDSLTLFSPARFSALPGRPFPATVTDTRRGTKSSPTCAPTPPISTPTSAAASASTPSTAATVSA